MSAPSLHRESTDSLIGFELLLSKYQTQHIDSLCRDADMPNSQMKQFRTNTSCIFKAWHMEYYFCNQQQLLISVFSALCHQKPFLNVQFHATVGSP